MMLAVLVASSGLAALLPQEVRGWKASSPDGVFDASTLFDHIDGAAEVYRALGVREVLYRRYLREGGPEISADLFDMGSAEDAYGAYHHDIRDEETAGIGRESEYVSGALAFWKGRYFVSILALEETMESREAVFELARAIAGAIAEEGEPPALLRLLPDRGLLRSQIHYFHSQPSLDRYGFAEDPNLLLLGDATRGVIARYRAASSGGPPPYVLLLVTYPSETEARAAALRLGAQWRRGGWGGARASGPLLIVVSGAPDSQTVAQALEEVARRAGLGGSHG